MKLLYTFIIIATTLLVSCKKEQLGNRDVKTPVINLTQDELTRLPLLAANPHRSPQEILQLVKNSDTKSATLTSISDSLVFNTGATKSANGEELIIYIINNPDSKGFTMVTKDRILPPIVGYSEQGEFDRNNVNPGFEIMMNRQAAELLYMRDSIEGLKDDIYSNLSNRLRVEVGTKGPIDGEGPPGGAPTEPWTRFEMELKERTNIVDSKLGPMLSTRWGQDYPYNNLLGSGYTTGCAATAVAQIMAYHRYPASYNNHPYLWSTYATHKSGYWDYDAFMSIGLLMKDLGEPQNLNMQYKVGNSGSERDNSTRAFANFGYYVYDFRDYNASDISGSLYSNRPVYIQGDNDEAGIDRVGHEWVIDGILSTSVIEQYYLVFYNMANVEVGRVLNSPQNTGYYGQSLHHNFGWNGSYDSWITIHGIDPKYIGGNEIHENLRVIPNIRPR